MIAEAIEKRPWTIIVAWIIIVIIFAPMAMRINSVMTTNIEKLIPQNVEGIKAMNELNSLRISNRTGGEGNYLIVVNGVKVSLDTYQKLYPWYYDLKKEYPQMNFTSWLDVVNLTEREISTFLKEGITNMINATNQTIVLAENYNKTLEGINGLTQLVLSTDKVYSGVYRAGSALGPTAPSLLGVLRALNSTCNSFLIPMTKLYFNIIRVEAALETYTQAYETGELSLDDIAVVLNHMANLSSYGVNNPPLGLVIVVYKYVLSQGGPLNFTNTKAVNLTYSLYLEYTPKSALGMLKAAEIALNDVVSHDGNHRDLLKIYGVSKKAQLELWKRLTDLLPEAELKASLITADSFAKTPQAKKLMEALAVAYATKCSCSPKNLTKSLIAGLAYYLNESKMPEDLANITAINIVKYNKNFTKVVAARIASEYVLSKVPPNQKAMLKNLTEYLPNIILEADSNATGNISKEEALKVATELMIRSLGMNMTSISLNGITTAREAAMKLMFLVAKKEGGEKAVNFINILKNNGLLGAPLNVIRNKLPSILASMASKQFNVSEKDILPIARAAVDAYFEHIPPKTLIETYTEKELNDVFPKIISKIKGLLVSRDLDGFIISVSMKGNISDKVAVNMLSNAVKSIERDLKNMGYSQASALYGGEEVINYESKVYADKDVKNIDKFSSAFTLIILGLILESVVAAFLPFVGIGLGIITALGTVFGLAKLGIIDVSTYSRVIMFTTGLGLGIDYAGYVAKRFREEAVRLSSREAAAEAFRKSWRPVIAGATTAAIGFGSMSIARNFGLIRTLGTNIPIAIILVMIASITFIPALLAYVGETRWFWWPSKAKEKKREEKTSPKKTSMFLVKRSGAILIVVIIAAALGSIPVIKFTGSYDPALNLPTKAMSYKALKVIENNYDPGFLYPVYVIASNSNYALKIKSTLMKEPYVRSVEISKNYKGDRVLEVILSVYPMSKQGMDVTKEIREIAHKIDPNSLVGGEPAVYLDIENLVHNIFYHKVYPIALTLMFITMWAIYGGAVLALAVIASVILGAIWGIATTVGVYQHLLNKGVIWMLPIIVFTAILGVGMDYNSFFLARAREECEKECSREAVARALSKSAALVMGLASAMASAYASIAISSIPTLSEMGVALTLGVILTGFNASVILSPQLLALLGSKAWWPLKIGVNRNERAKKG